MPLKIRCPHCFRVLVAADDTAGETKLCPACKQAFTVPLPRANEAAASEPADTGPTCPHCGAEVGPTTTFCRQCHTDLKTGQRLPLKQRLRLFSWRFWAIGGCGAAVLVLLAFGAIHMHRIRAQAPARTFTPIAPQEIPATELATALLQAEGPAERRSALERLSGIESRAAAAVARALGASLEQSAAGAQTPWNRLAAIDLLARQKRTQADRAAEWYDVLARCQADPPLHEAALRARAMLGDARVVDELCDLWLEKVRRDLLIGRVVRASRIEDQPGAALMLRENEVEVARCADGLRALAAGEPDRVFGRLAEAYWGSWAWLGQGQGERLAEEVFDLGKPAEKTLEFRPEDVRGPRDVMKSVAEHGPFAARAAAGLILEQRGPQYKSLCRSIGEALGAGLAECGPLDQQRLTWAIGRLRGRLFGPGTPSGPLEVRQAEIAAALEWARPGGASAAKGPYAGPPVLTYRAVTANRLLERDLLAELQGEWPAARMALGAWLAADLGWTPRLGELLDPGQRRPNYPALAAALTIAAATNGQGVRPQLQLWREASDQPAWVRALAYTVLGSLDARRGRWESGWPAGLDLGDLRRLDAGEPGWECFGRVLAAGGPSMLERLTNFTPAPLSADVRAKLVEAAKTAGGKGASGDTPH